jgi:hypothetical protein
VNEWNIAVSWGLWLRHTTDVLKTEHTRQIPYLHSRSHSVAEEGDAAVSATCTDSTVAAGVRRWTAISTITPQQHFYNNFLIRNSSTHDNTVEFLCTVRHNLQQHCVNLTVTDIQIRKLTYVQKHTIHNQKQLSMTTGICTAVGTESSCLHGYGDVRRS